MAVIERVHLPNLDFFHLKPQALVLLLDLNVTFGLDSRGFRIVEARL